MVDEAIFYSTQTVQRYREGRTAILQTGWWVAGRADRQSWGFGFLETPLPVVYNRILLKLSAYKRALRCQNVSRQDHGQDSGPDRGTTHLSVHPGWTHVDLDSRGPWLRKKTTPILLTTATWFHRRACFENDISIADHWSDRHLHLREQGAVILGHGER